MIDNVYIYQLNQFNVKTISVLPENCFVLCVEGSKHKRVKKKKNNLRLGFLLAAKKKRREKKKKVGKK